MSSPPRPAAPPGVKRLQRKRSWAVPLAELVGPCIAPAVAKQGFGAAEILMHWPDIVGARLAAVCEPIRLQWPPRPRRAAADATPASATLVVRVEGAFALDLQHMAQFVIERANAHLGWRCVERLALRQGPLLRQRARRAVRPAVDPSAAARAAHAAAGIETEGLRQALERLGAQVLSANAR